MAESTDRRIHAAWEGYLAGKHRSVTAPLLKGLGTTLRTLKNLCRDDPEALDAIDRATANPVGRPAAETVDNVNGSTRPVGNSTAAALRRLRTQRPDLHAQVLAKEKSAHAAMIEAGFRKVKKALVPRWDQGPDARRD